MTNNQLLEIVSCALKGEKYQQKSIDEKEIIIQADQNGLLPILFVGIDENYFSKENYEKVQKRFFANVYNDTIQKTIITKVNDTLNSNGFDHLFLKGTHLKQVYPKSYYRPMGDIDVLIKKDKSIASRKVMKNNGFITSSRSAEHDVYLYDTYYVEVHRDIYQKENKKDKSPLTRPWDYAVLVDKNEYRLDYTFEGVYLLYHLKKHVLTSGIGLRSALDITIFFNHYEKEINLEMLNELLKVTNLTQFFQTILYINKKSYDLGCKFLDPKFSLSLENYQEILDYMSKSGTHGKGDGFNEMAPRVAKKGKIKTAFRLVFPKWSHMKESYAWLRYLPFLLPVAYIIRSFRFLFLKTKYTFSKLKRLGSSNTEAEKLDDTFTKMGL